MMKEIQTTKCQAEGCDINAKFLWESRVEEIRIFETLKDKKATIKVPLCEFHTMLIEVAREDCGMSESIYEMPQEMEITV